MTNEVFLDSGYAIALSVESDENHETAEEIAEQLEAEQTRLITTRAILLEIGNALSKHRYRKSAIELLIALEGDPTVEIVPLSEELYAHALELFRNRPDKEWGLVDCVSIIVMQEHGLTEVLTTDKHFEQAGFRALLRNEWQFGTPGIPLLEYTHKDMAREYITEMRPNLHHPMRPSGRPPRRLAR